MMEAGSSERRRSPASKALACTVAALLWAVAALVLAGLAWYVWGCLPDARERERLAEQLEALPLGIDEQEVVARIGHPVRRWQLPDDQGAARGDFGHEGHWLVQGSCASRSPQLDRPGTVLAYSFNLGMSFDEAWVILDKHRGMTCIWVAED